MTNTRFKTINVTYNIDPHAELNLTDQEREELNQATKNAHIEAIDRILAPYGAQVLGNGEIICAYPIPTALAENWDEIAEMISMIEIPVSF